MIDGVVVLMLETQLPFKLRGKMYDRAGSVLCSFNEMRPGKHNELKFHVSDEKFQEFVSAILTEYILNYYLK